jgi:hypothetical protein
MPATYEPIATTTLGSAAASITFSSIPATYTDLRVVLNISGLASSDRPVARFNSDTGSNYSVTGLVGDGSASAFRATSIQEIRFSNQNFGGTVPFFVTMDVASYANSTYKTVLCSLSDDENGSGTVFRTVDLWKSTSAINTIALSTLSSTNFNAGTTATLYGIKNA